MQPRAELAIAGPRGRAVRVALPPGNRSIVDMWLWSPIRELPDTPVSVHATRLAAGPGRPAHAITVSYLDRALFADLNTLGLPVDFATTVYAAMGLHVSNVGNVRETLRHTMRQVAHGVIPCPPVTREEKKQWQAAINANSVFAERHPEVPSVMAERGGRG